MEKLLNLGFKPFPKDKMLRLFQTERVCRQKFEI